jgi:hypothetical protein
VAPGAAAPRRIASPRPVTVWLLADAFGLTGADRDQFCRAASDPPSEPELRLAQLPADFAGFIGRTDELLQLATLMPEDGVSLTAVVITAIAGTAGIGKSALAIHWGHHVRNQFPDGQL